MSVLIGTLGFPFTSVFQTVSHNLLMDCECNAVSLHQLHRKQSAMNMLKLLSYESLVSSNCMTCTGLLNKTLINTASLSL